MVYNQPHQNRIPIIVIPISINEDLLKLFSQFNSKILIGKFYSCRNSIKIKPQMKRKAKLEATFDCLC